MMMDRKFPEESACGTARQRRPRSKLTRGPAPPPRSRPPAALRTSPRCVARASTPSPARFCARTAPPPPPQPPRRRPAHTRPRPRPRPLARPKSAARLSLALRRGAFSPSSGSGTPVVVVPSEPSERLLCFSAAAAAATSPPPLAALPEIRLPEHDACLHARRPPHSPADYCQALQRCCCYHHPAAARAPHPRHPTHAYP